MTPVRRWAAAAALAGALAVAPLCAAAAAAAAPPPSTSGHAPQDQLEKGLWFEMEEQERLLRESKLRVADPALNEYVRGVLCRVVGRERCAAARIYIVRTPYFNASMAPNGAMLVYTGLLLRMRDEAQLAAVLAHEFTHFEQRHTLKLFRQVRARTDALSWLSFVPVPYVGMLGQVALIGGIYSFSRDMEREADAGSIRELAGAGYDARTASQIWSQLGAELDATARVRGHKSEKDKNGGLFATHPKSTERMAALAKAAEAVASARPGMTNAAQYRASLAAWWPRLIEDQVKLQDFGGTEYLLATLAGSAPGGWTPDLLYARGELYRSRGKAGDFAAAAEFYRQAIEAARQTGAPVPPEAWRGLGLSQLRLGRAAEGRVALRDYLARKPAAGDAPMIAHMAQAN